MNKGFGVSVHTKGDELLVIIVDRVEVLQEQVTEKEVAVVVLVQRVLCDSELANCLTLVEVSRRAQIENGLSNLEANWFHKLCNFCAAFSALAESGISLAIQV